MKNLKFYFIIFISAIGCSTDLSINREIIEVNDVHLPKQIVESIKTDLNKEFKLFQRINYYYNLEDSGLESKTDTINNGFYFSEIPEQKAKLIIKKYQDSCKKYGNYIFFNELNFDKKWNSLYNITIIKASNQYEVIKIMNTEAVNYDLSNNQIIEQIKKWDKIVGLDIIVIDNSRIEANINILPKKLSDFTKEVYDFCPDVIDQGYNEMSTMIEDYKLNKYFWLWWD